MKLSLSLTMFLAAAGSVSAFAPSTFGVRPATMLQMARADTSDAIKAAMEASKKFGPTSPEARVAWDAVEEMDSADNSAAFSGSLNEECLTEGEASKACMEYGEKLDELADLVKQQHPYVEQMKGLASEIQRIKLVAQTPGEPGQDSPQLRAAVKEAKEASEKFGATSPEAKVAWDTVEEIAGGSYANALGGKLEEECLVEAMEACEALDELNRALNLESK